MPGSITGGVGPVDCKADNATATVGASGAAVAAAVGGEGDIMEEAVAAGCRLILMFFA